MIPIIRECESCWSYYTNATLLNLSFHSVAICHSEEKFIIKKLIATKIKMKFFCLFAKSRSLNLRCM